MNTSAGFFVWLRTSDWRASLICEKWPADIPCTYLKREHAASEHRLDHGRVVVKKWPIAAIDMKLSLAELAAIFPPPQEETT